MTYCLIKYALNYSIARITETYKNNYVVELIPENISRKIKLTQKIFDLDLALNSTTILEFLQKAKNLAEEIDIELLRELLEEDKSYLLDELATIYFGDNITSLHKTALVFKINSEAVSFHDNEQGKFIKLNDKERDIQIAALKKARSQQEQLNSYYEDFISFKKPNFPEEFNVIKFLTRPDKNSLEYKALILATTELKIPPFELCFKVGLIENIPKFFIDSFIYENPIVTNKAMFSLKSFNLPVNLELDVFSIDDSSTTEIDDAFSIQFMDDKQYTVGIHIAAPALSTELGEMVANNISTVYYPGGKITMLPDEVIKYYSLNENKELPVVSIYFVLNQELGIDNYYSRLEIVKINKNLRIEELGLNFNQESLGLTKSYPYERELKLLYEFAKKLEEKRGKPLVNALVVDYSFKIENDKITITPRVRGNPIDKLVSELMILANCSWGRMLTNAFIPAVYRVKEVNQPVTMTLTPKGHAGLNVDYYTWSTSPLRRAADYINQKQIISLLKGSKDFYTAVHPTLLEVVENFDSKYAKYIAFQDKMELYWSLKYLIQENITELSATIIYKTKAQLEGVPIQIDTLGLIQPKPVGSHLKVKIFNINLLTLHFEFKILTII